MPFPRTAEFAKRPITSNLFFSKAALQMRTILLSWRLFGHVGKRLDKKSTVDSKFITSLTEKQIITIDILPNISRSKGNQAMIFDQLIECRMEKYFSSKIRQKMRQGDSFQTSFF